ncbi:MAG: DUF362 domain-containing protein [Bryobacter sp.]|nr:DUF362 domain-containing protein [Bryobacter sp.]
MLLERRDLVRATLLATAARGIPLLGASAKNLGIPGPYPGRVVAVHHPASIAAKQYNREAVRAMMHRGMMELTGAPSWQEAWRVFFEPGDVVGVKFNPVGQPHVIGAPEVFQTIFEGLEAAGVKRRDIVGYDRYQREFLSAGFDKWLPEGARWTYATSRQHPLQLDMDGYDPDHYMEMALALPSANPSDRHHRRSYVARFLTKDVNKMINVPLLKHHQSAGVTLALKNLSHGLVNNVSRSHSTPSNNSCGVFIPAVVDLPVIRQKVVLNILDGVQGAYHGGPGRKCGKYVFEHKTMYFATDPVAMDLVGWDALDAERVKRGLKPVALAERDEDSTFVRMQPEHIDIAGTIGLGVGDRAKLDVRRVTL